MVFNNGDDGSQPVHIYFIYFHLNYKTLLFPTFIDINVVIILHNNIIMYNTSIIHELKRFGLPNR